MVAEVTTHVTEMILLARAGEPRVESEGAVEGCRGHRPRLRQAAPEAAEQRPRRYAAGGRGRGSPRSASRPLKMPPRLRSNANYAARRAAEARQQLSAEVNFGPKAIPADRHRWLDTRPPRPAIRPSATSTTGRIAQRRQIAAPRSPESSTTRPLSNAVTTGLMKEIP